MRWMPFIDFRGESLDASIDFANSLFWSDMLSSASLIDVEQVEGVAEELFDCRTGIAGDSLVKQAKPLRCLEFFSGIGGFAIAAQNRGWQIACAMDIDQCAAQVYRLHFDHEHLVRTIESIPFDELASYHADLWWLSPPCQPFTRRGIGRGWEDRRSEALRYLIKAIGRVGPPMLALENRPRIRSVFGCRSPAVRVAATRVSIQGTSAVPHGIGEFPIEDCVYYLMAKKGPIQAPSHRTHTVRRLPEFIEENAIDGLFVNNNEIARFASAIDCVRADDSTAIASCFTSRLRKITRPKWFLFACG